MSQKQDLLNVTLNGESLWVPEGVSVAAALSLSGEDSCRRFGQRASAHAVLWHGGLPGVPGDRKWPAAAGVSDPLPAGNAD
jgi:hypothetical protein